MGDTRILMRKMVDTIDFIGKQLERQARASEATLAEIEHVRRLVGDQNEATVAVGKRLRFLENYIREHEGSSLKELEKVKMELSRLRAEGCAKSCDTGTWVR